MKWNGVNLLVEIFGYENFSFGYFRQLVDSDSDIEALQETSAFLGVSWSEVSPLILRKNFCAFSFFSDFAFLNFTPALIRCSIEDGAMSHLTVADFLNCLRHQQSSALGSFYARRWRQFSRVQLELVRDWLLNSEGAFLEFFDSDEIADYVGRLESLIVSATQAEELFATARQLMDDKHRS